MSQYLDLFIQESDEQLEILEQETLKLEEDPSDERLQVIFRAAHTLKGSSRAMGFSNFAELTHEMENVLDKLRHATLSVDTEIADAMLECIDTLGQMADSIGAGRGDAVDCSNLVETLRHFQGHVGSAPEPVNKQPQGESCDAWVSHIDEDHFDNLNSAAKDKPVYHTQFRLHQDCVMKYVRAFMAVSIVQENGELLVCVPEQEALEEEEFDRDFELVFQSEAPESVLRKRFSEISEIEKFTLEPWDEEKVKASKVQVNAEQHAPAKPTGDKPGAPAGAKQVAATSRRSDAGQTVRVDVTRLDNLMNLVGELVIDRTRITQIGHDLAKKYNDQHVDDLELTVSHIARITSDLQDQIMKARMMPIETVFNRFPRVVRDLAKKLGKEVHLELLGGDTELDRSVIEIIGDPLLHILRNSIDHGLEMPDERVKIGKPKQGRVVVSAKHQENHIVIEIIDDGKGIDVQRIKQKAIEIGSVDKEEAEKLTDKELLQFVFVSGLSTVSEVSEVSGRGVGMDIVSSNIHKVGGLIDLESTPGEGTHFTLRLPLTLAIIRGLLINVWEKIYVLPLGSVVETLLIDRKQIQTINKCEVIVIRDVTVPLLHLRDIFDVSQCDDDEKDDENSLIYVVVVGIAEQRVGLVVDGLIGEQEVVIKSLSRFCGDIDGVSGATILGDGNVALICDVNGIAKAA